MDYQNSDIGKASPLPLLLLPCICVCVCIRVGACVGVVICAGVVIVDHYVDHIVDSIIEDLSEDKCGNEDRDCHKSSSISTAPTATTAAVSTTTECQVLIYLVK